MEGRAWHRKPKVSRLLGDEAERIIGLAQWTGGDIVYTSNPTIVRSAQRQKERCLPFSLLLCRFHLLASLAREKVSRLYVYARARRICRVEQAAVASRRKNGSVAMLRCRDVATESSCGKSL